MASISCHIKVPFLTVKQGIYYEWNLARNTSIHYDCDNASNTEYSDWDHVCNTMCPLLLASHYQHKEF